MIHTLEAKNLDKLLNCIGNVGDVYTILENSKCDALVGELQREKMLSEVTKKSAKNADQNATIEILVLIMFAAFGILFFSFLLNAVILEKSGILNMLLGISSLMTAAMVSLYIICVSFIPFVVSVFWLFWLQCYENAKILCNVLFTFWKARLARRKKPERKSRN